MLRSAKPRMAAVCGGERQQAEPFLRWGPSVNRNHRLAGAHRYAALTRPARSRCLAITGATV